MKTVKALFDGRPILQKVFIADHFFTRLMGLMYRKGLEPETGMLIRPCSQIHTFGMRFPIDAVFLTKDGEVLSVESSVAPHRISPYVKKSRQVLELTAGTSGNLKPGDRIVFEK